MLLSNHYGIIGRELKVEAIIKGLGDSDGLALYFWADTPSGKIEELAAIKTKKLSNGEEASYTTEIISRGRVLYRLYKPV